MSWNTFYDYKPLGDSFTGDDYGPPGDDGFMGSSYTSGGSQFGKRPHSPDLSQQFKKPKPFGASAGGNDYDDYSSGPTSWDQLGSGDSFGGGNFSSADEGPSSWDSLSGPTSWDQLSSEPKGMGGAGRSRGRGGGNRGGAGGRGGGGNFGSGGNFSAGNKFGEGNFGGGGNFSAGDNDSYGDYGGGNFGGKGNFGGGGNFGQSNFGGGGKPRGQRGGAARGGGGRGQGGGVGQQFGPQSRGGGRGGGRGGVGGGGGRGGGFGGPRGRPQRGRGAGYGSAGQPGKKMSLVDKFVKFGDFLRNEGVRVNAIQSIENGCTALQGLGLKTEYTEDALPRIYNRPLFTGKLCISGIYLARSLGHNKKALKHEVYDMALKVLTQNTVAEINDLRDPGMDSLKATIELFLKEDVKGLASSARISMEAISQKLKDKMLTVNNQQLGLKKLIAYLKTTPNLPESRISQLEQGIQASKCNLPHSFECTEERGADGERKFVGAFMFGDLCIARGEDEKFKKQCKEATYNQAMDALLNKPLSELLISVIVEPSPEEESETVVQEETGYAAITEKLDETGFVKGRPPPIKSEPIEARLKEFMRILNTTAFQEDNIHNMDNLANHFNLTIMCLFRKASPTSEVCSGCELYIENYLIATGYGESKKECQLEAYCKAWETLTMYSTQDILTQHKKLNPEETAGPSVMEVFIKGATGIQRESNLHSLRRFGLDPYDETKKAESMVIVECADWSRDRKFNAFCILQYSATANGMLLQWSCETVRNKHKPNYRYEKRLSDRLRLTLYLQSKEIAMSEGPGKNKVRNNAAAIALFKMYETHDVIKIVKLKDEERWIAFEQIEEECNTLRRKAGQPPRQKSVFEGWDTKVDDYLIAAVKSHMTRFFPRDDAEELLFGPGLPNAEIKCIQAYASSLKLRCDTRQFNEEIYLVVYHRQDMQKVVRVLKEMNGGTYGKYKLVSRDELPNSDSIKHLMKGQQSL